jgi:hypothetical protein
MCLAWQGWALVAVTALLAACSSFDPKAGPPMSSPCMVTQMGTTYGEQPTTTVTCPDGGTEAGGGMVRPGLTTEVLVADQLNNRVILVDRTGAIEWQFGDGDSPGPSSVVAPNDAEYLPSGDVLIAGTGSSSVQDDRVFIVSPTGKSGGTITWVYGGHGTTAGSGSAGLLAGPTSARLIKTTKGDHLLISDQGHGRVVEIDQSTMGKVWEYPTTLPRSTISPQSAERLSNGDTLIADQGGNLVIEVNPLGEIVWQYPGVINPEIDFPSYASRLPNGHTLIADTLGNDVVEIDSSKPPRVVWSYVAKEPNSQPTGAVRLENGDTLITLLGANKVVEVDPTEKPIRMLSSVTGSGPGTLNQPYNAKAVNDYTGISAPPPAP